MTFKKMGISTTTALVKNAQSLINHGRSSEALNILNRILSIESTDVFALLCKGLALKGVGKLHEACNTFDQVITIQPDSVEAHVNRAAILQKLGQSSEALASSDRALSIKSNFAPAHCNRGLALYDLERPLEALQSYDRAIEIDPNFVAAHGNRGKTLQALGRPEEALSAYQRVISLQPNAARAYMNASHTYLLLGQFKRGWALYEWRKRLPTPLGNRVFAQPSWLGSPDLKGMRLLVHWEQGLGDTIQFCRYAALARARGATVSLMVQKKLCQLVRTLDANIDVCADDELKSDFDYHCPLLSLPHAFGTRMDSIPAKTPYLFAEPERILRWRARIGNYGFKVGINWQGNKQSPTDRGRSFPLSLFHRISLIPGVRLISLQAGTGTEQLRDLPSDMIVENLGSDFDNGLHAFLDSAAVMQSLDLIITSDTALAHLAGALARPTWVALQHVPDWRWLRDRENSPWYPILRLFRQTHRGCWGEVFDAMHFELLSKLRAFPLSDAADKGPNGD